MGSAGSPTAARRKTNRLCIVYKQIYYTSMDERFKIHKELKHLPHLLGTHSFFLGLFDFKGYLQVLDVDPKGDQLQQLLLLVNRVTFLYDATIFPFRLFTPSNI